MEKAELTMTADEITGWDELVKKCLALEEEVKTLTLKNMELTQKLEMYERIGNVEVEGHNKECQGNAAVTELEEELKRLKEENLELTWKFQMKKMWNLVLEEILSVGSKMNLMNEEKREWLERHNHPLSNDVVLENLFSYVGRPDLLGRRGVCHKWNELTIPFTRSKFTVRIYHSENPEAESRRTMEDFVAIFSQNRNRDGIHFAKFKLGPFCATDVIGQQFLQLCGDTTTELDLCQGVDGNDCGCTSGHIYLPHSSQVFRVEDVSAILRSMPNLKKLSMSDKLVSDSGNVVELFPGVKAELRSLQSLTVTSCTTAGPIECCPSFLEELIKAAVNISHLGVADSWHTPDVADEDTEGNILQALNVFEKLGRESSIQSLTLGEVGIKMRPHVEILRRLAAKSEGLKLKKLSFRVSFVDIDEGREIEHFQSLEMFKDTLEDLEISSFWSSFIDLPKMPKLRRLALIFHAHLRSGLVNLNKIFPILKELIVCEDGGEDDSIFEFLPHSDPCPSVKSLSLCRFDLRINEFNHILTTFPTLTKLVIQVKEYGSEILRQIWTHMTQLETLAIIGMVRSRESMDSLFTGIPPPAIREVSAALNYLDRMSVEWRRDAILNLMNQHCRLPSIQNLTKLRRLTLGVTVCGPPGRPDSLKYISDVTGFLGFYSLKHLSHLSVCDTRLTKECCEILRMEMEVGLESWEFTSVDDKEIVPPRKAEVSDVYWSYWNEAQTLLF